MKNLLLLLLFVSEFAFSQQKNMDTKWHLTIIDSATSKRIERVTISIGQTRSLITDVDGATDIDKHFLDRTDTISISCIGYKSVKLIPGINHILPDTVRLSALVRQLKGVKIGLSKLKEITLGDLKKSYNTHRITNPETENAQYIPNGNKIKGIIISVNYIVNDKLKGIEMPFKVGLYTKSKNNPFPDKELIEDSIIVYNPEKKTHLSVDVSKYNIQLPEDGVIVAFEPLSPSRYGKDSIWYNGHKMLRMPGIDMDLKRKGDYAEHPHDYVDRKTPYSLVIDVADKWDFDQLLLHSYLYDDGNNFAITITIEPD